ncbi:MAG: hypothetical protein FWG27_02705 [Treponema sp.]|nr:hypothetical protein [Treponema sp.]
MPDNPRPVDFFEEPAGFFEKITAYIGKAGVVLSRAAVFLGKVLVHLGRKSLPVLKIMAPSFILAAVIFVLLLVTGLGDVIGKELAALTGPVSAALIIFAVCFIPALSPLLGAGLLIAIAAGVFTGERIAAGAVSPFLALPALLAIDAQIGGSFIASRFTMGENDPETINAGVPGIVFTRLITIPIAVILAYLFI